MPAHSARAATTAGPANPINGYIHTSGTAIYDGAGNQVRFFGIDSAALVYGPPTSACPGTNWRAISSQEVANEAQWGFNEVRLAVSWADLEPSAPTSSPSGLVHNWNVTYLDALSTAVQEYNQAGIAVILDIHQSDWSPAWNKDNSKVANCQGTGFPLWMFPNVSTLSRPQAMCDFYNNVPEPGVSENPQDGLVAVEAFLAGYFAPGNATSHGQVIAFDMLNEPQSAAGTSCQGQVGADMLSLYENVGMAIRSADPPVALIYEDYSSSTYEIAGFMLSSPLNMSNAIISVHDYAANWNEPVPSGCENQQALPFYTAHLQQAQDFGQPLWIGEFNGFHTQDSCRDSIWQSDVTTNLEFDTANDISWSFWDYTTLSLNLSLLPYLEAGMVGFTPVVAITTPAATAPVSGTLTVTGTVSDGNSISSVLVSLGGGTAETATGTNSWSAQFDTTALPNGSDTIAVSATDSADNVGTASETVTVNNSPVVAITTPAANAPVSGTLTVTGTVSDGNSISSVLVSLGGGTAETATGTNSWSAQFDTTALPNGSDTIAVSATDSADNVGTASETVTVNNSSGGTSCPTTAGMTELSGNVSVETGERGWTGTYNSHSVVSRVEPAGGSYDGRWALRISPKSGYSGTAGVTNAAPAWVPGSPGPSTTGGAPYTGSIFVKASVPGQQVALTMRETTAGGTGVAYHTATVTLHDTGWHRLTLTYTAVHTGDAIHYSLYGDNFAKSAQYILADCLSLQTKTKTGRTGAADDLSLRPAGDACAVTGSLLPLAPASGSQPSAGLPTKISLGPFAARLSERRSRQETRSSSAAETPCGREQEALQNDVVSAGGQVQQGRVDHVGDGTE